MAIRVFLFSSTRITKNISRNRRLATLNAEHFDEVNYQK